MLRKTLTSVVVALMVLAGPGGERRQRLRGKQRGRHLHRNRRVPRQAIARRHLPRGAAGVQYLRDLLLTYLGGTNLGIVNCSDSRFFHYEGRAFDWGINASNPTHVARVGEVIAWLLATDERGNPHANARRLGIGEIIWNRSIIALWTTSSKTWETYTGSNPHTDHVHFSFSWPGARMETSFHRSRASTPQFALSNSITSGLNTIPHFTCGFGTTETVTGNIATPDWQVSRRSTTAANR